MTGPTDSLGLDAVELRLYETLVDTPMATDEDLRRHTGLDSESIRKALTALTRRGMVICFPGTPQGFSAVAPDLAFSSQAGDLEEQARRLRLHIEHLGARFRAAVAGRPPAGLAEVIEVVTGQEEIVRRSQQIQYSARRQVRAIDKPPYARQPGGFSAGTAEHDQLRRGVGYRVIYDPAGLEHHELQEGMEAAIAAGERARVVPSTPTKMLIADHDIAWLPLHMTATTLESIVVVRIPAIVEALGALFEMLWRQALPLPLPGGAEFAYPAQGADPAHEPSDDERRLLSLLIAGVPDGVAARQLGMSDRTLHRRISSLMERLGAQTRLQLGAQAAMRGWIDELPPD